VAIGGQNLVISLCLGDKETINGVAAWRVTPSQKFRGKNPLENSRLDFLGSRRDHPIDYLPKGQTINAEYYSSLLVQLKDIFKEKLHGKFT